MKKEKLIEVIGRHIGHYSCEDGWYSCPKSEGGCINEDIEDLCNCGRDEKIKDIALDIIRSKTK